MMYNTLCEEEQVNDNWWKFSSEMIWSDWRGTGNRWCSEAEGLIFLARWNIRCSRGCMIVQWMYTCGTSPGIWQWKQRLEWIIFLLNSVVGTGSLFCKNRKWNEHFAHESERETDYWLTRSVLVCRQGENQWVQVRKVTSVKRVIEGMGSEWMNRKDSSIYRQKIM